MTRLVAAVLACALHAHSLCALQVPLTLEDRTLVTSFDDVAALAFGRDRLFVASDAGVAVRDVLQQRWLPPLAPAPGYPSGGHASALAYDAVADGLWLGTETGELYQLAFAFGEWTRASFVADGPVIRIHPDPAEGVLWVGTPSGWYRVRDDGESGRFMIRADMVPDAVRSAGEQNLALLAVQGTLGLDERMRRYDITGAVPADREGLYYVGTAGGGVVRIDTNSLERTWLPFGTPSRGIGSVAVVAGRLWFGGDGQGPRNGVASATRDLASWIRFAAEDGAPRGFVARIVAAPDAVWFATSEGAYRIGAPLESASWERLTSRDGLPADQTTTVAPVPNGAWIGTLRGLARVDASSRVVSTSLEGMRVLDLVASRDTLWAATDRGLFAVVDDQPVAVDEPALANGPVVAVAAGSDALAALTPQALHVRRSGSWAAPDRSHSRLGGLLRLRYGPEGGLWIAGENGVAVIEAGGTTRTWLVPVDIPQGPVRGLEIDGDDVWVATPAGALRIDRRR